MRRISSRMTFFYKRIFPIIWIGFSILFITVPFVAPLIGRSAFGPSTEFFLGPVIMIFFGYFFMKKLLFDLVDEVLDAGDALVIRNGHLEERVALSDIMNVGYSPFMNPPRVTLSLRNPSMFGDRVSFCAPVSLIPLSSAPIIDELIQRIDAARRVGAAPKAGKHA